MEFKKFHISYEDTVSFSKLISAYAAEDASFEKFISGFPNKASVLEFAEQKKEQKIDRTALVEVLHEQYQASGLESSQIEKLLSENCFTICAAHQPNIFSGYLYSIYKIVHAIKMANSLSESSDYDFLPIFFIGSEDHDLEEIGAFNFHTKSFAWESGLSGACGRMSTESLLPIRDEILAELNVDVPWLSELIRDAYDGKRNLTEATRVFYDGLFGKHGLIIIDADDERLKKGFMPVVEKELSSQFSYELVNKRIVEIEEHFKAQVEPREINLFYLEDGMRERILEDRNDKLLLANGDTIEKSALSPKHYSPNVILRPLYQEMILPNVAFIGGGSEVAYWMELKTVFEEFDIPFPIIFQRNSLAILSEKVGGKMKSFELSDIFHKKDDVLKSLVEDDADYQDLESALEKIKVAYDEATKKAEGISPNLKVSADAHLAKIDRIQTRLLQKYRAHLKRNEVDVSNALDLIQGELSPDGKLQERRDNFLTLCDRFGINIIDVLMVHQDPWSKEFLVLIEEG